MSKKKEFTVAICGNPNSGKTTIFNGLVGARQHTGNWPGVTVERKEGEFRVNSTNVKLVDLPGTYSFSYSSIDEQIAVDFLVRERPDLAVVVIDSSNLERNLYLVIQLLELKVPVVVNLNMIDLAKNRGMRIKRGELEAVLGAPVVESVGNKKIGIAELKSVIVREAERKRKVDFRMHYQREIEEAIEALEPHIAPLFPDYPSRWVTLQLLEENPSFLKSIKDRNIRTSLEKYREKIERRLRAPVSISTAERRYSFIYGLCKEIVHIEKALEDRFSFSDKIDKVLLNRWFGLPIFLVMLFLLFKVVFGIGTPIADLLDEAFANLAEYISTILTGIGAPTFLISLISEGIIPGLSSILVFVPNIALLFLGIALLEDSGYMARVAFIMDRIMHIAGLHGKSFIPMVLGLGCNVPAIMATRTLETKKDRIITILINPLISCSARLPVYLLFIGIFFRGNKTLVLLSLYLLGIILAVILARVFRALFFKAEEAPLIMELPPYHLPALNTLLFHAWGKTRLFLRKAGTIIFLGVIIVWALAYLPPGAEYGSVHSLIGRLGKFLAPLLRPAGFGYWQAAVALLFGIVAKEIVVSTFGTLYGGETALRSAIAAHFTPLSAYAFMIMSLIYIPCIATIGVIKQEAGWRWALLSVGYSLALGWMLAVLVYQVGRLF